MRVEELFRASSEERQQYFQDSVLRNLKYLPDDILWIIFDFCNFSILCAISKDPSRLNESTNDYVYLKFKTKMIVINSPHSKDTFNPSSNPFRSSIRNILIYGTDKEWFSYVDRMWPKTLFKIIFSDTFDQVQLASGAPELADCIQNTMENVKIVKFYVNQFDGPLCDSLLKKTKNMSQLIIALKEKKTKIRSKQSNGYKNVWFFRQYPALRRIEWNVGIVNHPDDFKILLNLNKKLKHLTFTQNIDRVLDFLERTEPYDELQENWNKESVNWKIQNLQRLDIGLFLADIPNIARICSRLNDLYEDGCYHQLFITSSNRSIFKNDLVASLRGLTGITINGSYVPSMERAPLLRELAVAKIDNGGTAAAKHLGSLEKLKLRNASIRDIRPFISHAPNIREISIKYVRREPLDSFDALNELREKLPNARTLVIYLEEWAYIALKQYSATPKKIEIRRIESLYD